MAVSIQAIWSSNNYVIIFKLVDIFFFYELGKQTVYKPIQLINKKIN